MMMGCAVVPGAAGGLGPVLLRRGGPSSSLS